MTGRRIDGWETWWPRIRTVVLCATGWVLFVWEAAFREGEVRWQLLAAYFALIGVPLVLHLNGTRSR